MALTSSDVHRALKELAGLRFGSGSLDEGVQRIVDTTHRLFNVDGAGLLLADSEQLLRNLVVSDVRLRDLEELQIRFGEGPCMDAYNEKQLVHSGDLQRESRWPDFVPAAVRRGVRAVLAAPIPYDRQAIGVVAVVSGKVHPWSPESELALVAFTDLAALLIASMMQGEEKTQIAAQLQQALDARIVIEQAKGVVVARQGVSPRQAYESLRSSARAQRRRLAEVAREVVEEAQSAPGAEPDPHH
jgi:GAF domain-containing protein